MNKLPILTVTDHPCFEQVKPFHIMDVPDKEDYAFSISTYPVYHVYRSDEDLFDAIYTSQQNDCATLIDPFRLHMIKNALLNTQNINGDIVEMGVYKGGSAYLIKKMIQKLAIQCNLHLFDTFEGIVKSHDVDVRHKEGEFADTSLEKVKNHVGDDSFINYYKGYVPDSLQDADIKAIRFCHLDLDLYEPTLGGLDFIYDKLSPSAVLLMDDYGFASCPGVRKAIDEFFHHKAEYPYVMPTGQAMIVKI